MAYQPLVSGAHEGEPFSLGVEYNAATLEFEGVVFKGSPVLSYAVQLEFDDGTGSRTESEPLQEAGKTPPNGRTVFSRTRLTRTKMFMQDRTPDPGEPAVYGLPPELRSVSVEIKR